MSEQNINDIKKVGEVQIADEVVTIIAGLAATEVDGVVALVGNITNDKVGKIGMKYLSKGVKIDTLQGAVSVDISLYIRYGYSIPDTTSKVQERVKATIENMTGLAVTDVRIRVAGVDVEKNN